MLTSQNPMNKEQKADSDLSAIDQSQKDIKQLKAGGWNCEQPPSLYK